MEVIVYIAAVSLDNSIELWQSYLTRANNGVGTGNSPQ